MQNKYVGDVGDFGKYGLLWALHGQGGEGASFRLGVVWYLVPDEQGTGDGGHVGYLSSKNRRLYRPCDESLYDKLEQIVKKKQRSVAVVQTKKVLPPDTLFYKARLTFDGMPAHGPGAREARLAHRQSWVQGALDQTERCDIVFVDPDNGLEVGVKAHHKRGPKYVFFDELLPYRSRGQSVVIYHHIGRNGTAKEQIDGRLSQIASQLGCTDVFALLYRRGTSRTFFVVPAANHKGVLLKEAARFLRGPWVTLGHFDPRLFRPQPNGGASVYPFPIR